MVHDNRVEFARIAQKIGDFIAIFQHFQSGQYVPVSIEDRLKRISVYVPHAAFLFAALK